MRTFFYRTVCYHTRDKQIELPLRGRPILLSLVWLQIELDSTQSYYHYLLCTQRIKSDLRSAREIWTALILWKINLRAGKSWFDGPSSEKMKVSPANFLAAIFFSQMFFSLPLLQSKFEQTFWMSTQTPLLKSNSWKSFKKHEIGSNSLHFDFWWKRLHNAGSAMSKAS